MRKNFGKSKFEQPKTLNDAIRIMTPVCKKIAKQYSKNRYDMFEDYLQQAYMGVARAWERYDETHKTAFTTYAFFYVRKEVQNLATPNWGYDNNTKPADWAPESSYTQSFEEMSAIHEFNKLDEYSQKIVRMRSEGYTFSEIAEEVGSSLGKVRNDVLEVQQRLAAE